jgi:GntR family transcriptional regulator
VDIIDRHSKTPLYKQVKDLLIKDIHQHMQEGDLLPNESQIEEKYQVSRITVRKAIDELVKEAIVFRQQGRGTFVRSTKIIQDASSITSWTEEMVLKGKKPVTRDMDIYEVEPSKKMVEKLELSNEEKVICIKRVRYANDEPIALMFNYLRAKYIPGFLEKGLSGESLYEELENRYSIVLEEANENIKARISTDMESSALRISPDSAVLHITRTSYLPNGTPLELVEMICRSDRYEYQIKLSGRNKSRVIE